MTDDARQTMTRARVELLHEHAFFGTLVSYLRPEPDPEIRDGWLDVRGSTLVYDPDAVAERELERVKLGLLNTVAHLALDHPDRQGARDEDRWRVAAEFAANATIAQSTPRHGPPIQVPDDWLLEARFFEQSAEEIYEKIRLVALPEIADWVGRVPTGAACRSGDADGAGDGGRCTRCGNGAWTRRVRQAARKAQGDLPGDLAHQLSIGQDGAVDWRAKLREFLTDRFREDFRWTPPNRRYLDRDFLVPSLSGQGGLVAFAVDTSGSMGDDEVAACVGEVREAMEMLPGLEVLLIQCDAEVQDVQRVREPDALDAIEVHGRGGTDFRPVFEEIDGPREDGRSVDALVYLTDLHGTFPAQAPAVPVLWVGTTGEEVPFGRVVWLEG